MKIRNRLIAFLLILLICSGISGCGKNAAIEISGTNVIGYRDATVNADGELTISIVIAGQVNFCNFEMELVPCDAMILTNIEENFGVLCNYEKEEGIIYLAFANAENVTEEVTICTLTFQLTEPLPKQDIIQIRVNEFSSLNADKASFTSEDYQLLYGTISSDGKRKP